MTKIRIESLDKDIIVPDVLWATVLFGVICGLGGVIAGFIGGTISDIVSWKTGRYF